MHGVACKESACMGLLCMLDACTIVCPSDDGACCNELFASFWGDPESGTLVRTVEVDVEEAEELASTAEYCHSVLELSQ